MPITIGYEPVAGIGPAALAGGQGDYAKWLAEQQQRERMQQAQIAANIYTHNQDIQAQRARDLTHYYLGMQESRQANADRMGLAQFEANTQNARIQDARKYQEGQAASGWQAQLDAGNASGPVYNPPEQQDLGTLGQGGMEPGGADLSGGAAIPQSSQIVQPDLPAPETIFSPEESRSLQQLQEKRSRIMRDDSSTTEAKAMAVGSINKQMQWIMDTAMKQQPKQRVPRDASDFKRVPLPDGSSMIIYPPESGFPPYHLKNETPQKEVPDKFRKLEEQIITNAIAPKEVKNAKGGFDTVQKTAEEVRAEIDRNMEVIRPYLRGVGGSAGARDNTGTTAPSGSPVGSVNGVPVFSMQDANSGDLYMAPDGHVRRKL